MPELKKNLNFFFALFKKKFWPCGEKRQSYPHKVASLIVTLAECDYMLLFEKLYVRGKIEKNLEVREPDRIDSVCVASGTLLHLSYACVGDRGSVLSDTEQRKCSLRGAPLALLRVCSARSVLL